MAAPRILFYCHNAIGLGHVIRSLRIADAAIAEGALCAIVTGCRFLSVVGVPSEIEVELLPPVRLDASGRAVALNSDDADDIIGRRSRRIVAFAERWRPDVIVVDHHPLGIGGELVDALLASNARFILGVPYAEALAQRPYRNPRLRAAISRYQDVLDYSDHGVGAAAFPGERTTELRIVRVGVVTKPPLPPRHAGPRPRLVALAGGGTGGAEVYRLVLEAMRGLPDWQLRLLVGPFGEAADVAALAHSHQGVEVWSTGTAEAAIRDATIVVSRAGYNTSYTLVQSDRPVVFIPQQLAGDDQPSRARRMAGLPKVWNLDSSDPQIVASLAGILRGDLSPVARALPFRIDGAAAAAREIMQLIVDDRSKPSRYEPAIAETRCGTS
jgi:predicted glycosyltransferase